MTAPVQKGEGLIVGLAGYLLTGHIVEEANPKPIADIDPYRDESDAVVTKVLSNPGKSLVISVIAKTGSVQAAAIIGAAVTVNSVAYMIEDVDPKYSRKALKLTLRLIKEDSMTYT